MSSRTSWSTARTARAEIPTSSATTAVLPSKRARTSSAAIKNLLKGHSDSMPPSNPRPGRRIPQSVPYVTSPSLAPSQTRSIASRFTMRSSATIVKIQPPQRSSKILTSSNAQLHLRFHSRKWVTIAPKAYRLIKKRHRRFRNTSSKGRLIPGRRPFIKVSLRILVAAGTDLIAAVDSMARVSARRVTHAHETKRGTW